MTTLAPPVEPEPPVKGRSSMQVVLRTFAQNKVAMAGVALIVLLILFSFVGPLIHKTNQTVPNLLLTNHAPGGGHLLGTDDSGFDVLGRLMVGGQSSLIVGFAVAAIATVVGIVYGAISGYFGGWIDAVMMRIVDIGYAIPVVFLFIFMSRIFKPTLGLLILLLAVVSWLVPARLVRGEALTLKTREYVQATKGMGARAGWTIGYHIVPNTIGTIVVTATFQVANAIMMLAILQYLGFGLPPSTPTWGTMLTSGTTFLQDGYWWQVYPALAMIVVTILAFNFIGDALQDAFSVRVREA